MPKRKILDQLPMGLRVSCPPGKCSSARIFYRITYDDRTEEYRYGKAIYNMPGILRVGEKPGPEVRGDLSVVMHAAALLQELIEYACLDLDGLLIKPKPELKRRRRR